MQPDYKSLEQGHSLRLKGRFDDAARAYKKYLRSLEKRLRSTTVPLIHSLDRADGCVGLAMTHRAMCRYQRSAELFTEAAEIYKQQKDEEGQAFVLYGLGGVLRFTGRFKEANQNLGHALKFAVRQEDSSSESFTLMALGGLCRMLGEYTKSLQYYKQALKISIRTDSVYGSSYAHCGIGNAFRMQGKVSEADKEFDMALKGYASIRDTVSRPYTFVAKALLDLENGKTCRLSEAKRMFTRSKDKRGLIHIQLVEAVRQIANEKSAKQILSRAEKASVKLGLELEVAHCQFLMAEGNNSEPYKNLGIKTPRSIYRLP
ncbi:MAG: tetratricopeptide repeat protein [Candidatus Lindowbacteria bacterium]|nr:tetratricopeptide repeat protein [Candidatus Lindowbacteria bacterium]